MTEPAYRCVDCFVEVPDGHSRCLECAKKKSNQVGGSNKPTTHPQGRGKANR